jgi:glycosyltransferase involved in cell wall biosynthesis
LNGAGANLIREAKAGIDVPAENGSALAEAIRSIYAMPDEKREEMGINGRRYYDQNFSHSKLVEQLISLFIETTRQYQGERQ